MGFFSKLFGSTIKQKDNAVTQVTRSWHYTGEGDCMECESMNPVEIPGFIPEDACGFFNLGSYAVSGHIINPKTGKQNKKTLTVNAISIRDAEIGAEEKGLLPPFSVEVSMARNSPPNEYQLANAKEYGIEIPAGAVDADVGAMVYRKTNSGGIGPTSAFASFCTRKRFLFSRFIGEEDLITLVYNKVDVRDRIALFVCAVDSALRGNRLGDPSADPRYYAFADSASAETIKLIEARGRDDLPVPRKGTKAWQTVEKYLAQHL